MKDREIDAMFGQAAQTPHQVSPELLASLTGSIGRSLRPVRLLPPRWVLECALILVSIAAALAGAAVLGFYGIRRMTVFDRALVFSALGLLLWLAAAARVAAMIPGSRRRASPGVLLGAACLLLLAVFAGLFRDYHTHRFVAQGLTCLTAGLLDAIPAAFAGWWASRRGFAVNRVAAGLVAGTLSGLAGVAMLELHCPNFEAAHVMFWHIGVIPVAAAAGALLAWTRGRQAHRRG